MPPRRTYNDTMAPTPSWIRISARLALSHFVCWSTSSMHGELLTRLCDKQAIYLAMRAQISSPWTHNDHKLRSSETCPRVLFPPSCKGCPRVLFPPFPRFHPRVLFPRRCGDTATNGHSPARSCYRCCRCCKRRSPLPESQQGLFLAGPPYRAACGSATTPMRTVQRRPSWLQGRPKTR